MESDDDTDIGSKRKKSIVDVNGEVDPENQLQLSQEEVARRSALAEGLQKIKVCFWESAYKSDSYSPILIVEAWSPR